MSDKQALVTFPPTEIVTACKKFIGFLQEECEQAHIASLQVIRSAVATGGKGAKNVPFPQGIRGKISTGKKAVFRSPEEQADSLLKRSPSCFSAHMTNKARHITVALASGGFKAGLDKLNLSKSNQEAFKTAWINAMKKAGLHNNLGVMAWGSGDEFHLQLPGAYKRTSQTTKLENRCIDAYLKLTREGKKSKNETFEKKKPNIKKLERASKRTGIAL